VDQEPKQILVVAPDMVMTVATDMEHRAVVVAEVQMLLVLMLKTLLVVTVAQENYFLILLLMEQTPLMWHPPEPMVDISLEVALVVLAALVVMEELEAVLTVRQPVLVLRH
tara:strand:- start:150 stop:482 length:333 start_codon:yes stop_codon:yes gene_type:complete